MSKTVVNNTNAGVDAALEILEAGPQSDDFGLEDIVGEQLQEQESHEEGMQERVEEEYADADAVEEDDAKQEEQQEEVADEAEPGEEGEESFQISRDDYQRLIEMLQPGAKANEVQPEPTKQEAPVPEAPKPEPLRDIAQHGLVLPKTDDEMMEILSTPEGYSRHISDVVASAVMTTIAEMEMVLKDRFFEFNAAMQFDRDFIMENPEAAEDLQTAIMAVQAAQRKLGPNPDYKELLSESGKNFKVAKRIASGAKKLESKRQPAPGRYAPKATRTQRPASKPAKMTPTEEAFAEMEIPAYDKETTELLRAVGTL